jgi:hypothetical protein
MLWRKKTLESTFIISRDMHFSLLRSQILGTNRFDYAFRKYIRDWAFRHPTPWDFFRSMESSSGEDLYWFWKGLILENYKLDQGITNVQSTDSGIIVSLANNEKMGHARDS